MRKIILVLQFWTTSINSTQWAMLHHEISALCLFLCAQVSLFLIQCWTSNFSSHHMHCTKNLTLAAATANYGIPSEETDSNFDFDFSPCPFALDANTGRKTFLEDVPAGDNIELCANTPHMLLSLVTVGLRWRSMGEVALVAQQRWWWTPSF